MRKPQIASSKHLSFGPVQIGRIMTHDIQLTNPTTEAIQVQLFVSYDLDKSFISKKTDNIAWTDKNSFKDKMLRQIEIFMKGVNLEYVANVEYMFR